MAATEVEEPSEPLNYKTWVLKVSIHCEGCKRKVKKILHTVEGVYNIDIDTKQQRAVVTGNVEADTLLKKLIKAGKHAELWPEKAADQKLEKKSDKAANYEEKPNDQLGSSTDEAAHGKEIKSPILKAETPVLQESAKSSQGTGGGGGASGGVPVNASAGVGGGKLAESTAGEKVVVESKKSVEEKKPETRSTGNQSSPMVVEKKGGETVSVAAENSGGGGDGDGDGGGDGKNKKKKKKKVQSVATEPSSAAPASGESPNHSGGPPPAAVPANHSPPRHHGYQYPRHYYAPSPPVYAVSYNTAHSSSTHTASYHTSPPPYSYAYTYSGSEMESSPSDFDPYTQQPLDSFEMFSDENPNGCSVV